MYLFFLIRAQNSNPYRRFLYSNDTWQMYFAREIDKRGELEENPFYEHVEQQPDDGSHDNKDVAMKDAVKEDPKQEDDKKDDPVQDEGVKQEDGIKQENGTKEDDDPKQASDEEQEQQQQPVKERRPINYFDMPLELRVHLLHTLCEVSRALLSSSNHCIHAMYVSCSGNWMMLSVSENILIAKKMLCIG